MMKMKKIIVTNLMAICMFSMVTCGANVEQNTNTTTETTEAAEEDNGNSESTTSKETATVSGSSKDLGTSIEEMIAELETTYHSLGDTIVDYSSYKEHKSEVDGFYGEITGQTEEIFNELNEASVEYFRYIFTEYAEDDKALDRAIDDYYDDVYSGILDDYYDDVYSGIMDDMYDDYYSGILDDAYDQVEYKEWSAASTDAYQMWSNTSSEVYKLWSEESSCCYRMWSEASNQYWKKNKDVDEVIESITEAKDKQDEASENREQETESGDEVDAKEENTAESESVTGVNPELKEALDAYEEFFNGYVDFMKKYQKASPEDMIAMMSDYTDYMLQYTDMMQKMQKIESEDLSTQDAAYYVEVTARIEQKLLTVTE